MCRKTDRLQSIAIHPSAPDRISQRVSPWPVASLDAVLRQVGNRGQTGRGLNALKTSKMTHSGHLAFASAHAIPFQPAKSRRPNQRAGGTGRWWVYARGSKGEQALGVLFRRSFRHPQTSAASVAAVPQAVSNDLAT